MEAVRYTIGHVLHLCYPLLLFNELVITINIYVDVTNPK
jgi:hypothetical protein